MKKILVIRFSSLGDIILLTPLFRETKRIFPQSKLHFLTSHQFKAICETNPHIDQQILFHRDQQKSEFSRILQLLKKEKYDLILDAHRSLRSQILLWRAFGFRKLWNQNIVQINKRSFKRNLLLFFKWNLFSTFPSQRKAYLQLLNKVKGNIQLNATTELFPSEEDQKKIQTLKKEYNLDFKNVICFGADASFQGKCWPKEFFLELGYKLYKLGKQIVLLGGKGDLNSLWIEEKSNYPIINFVGKLSYLGTAELLRHAPLVISNDSAIVHFAEAMNTPAISIFGPTAKEFGYGPYLPKSQLIDVTLKCRPCSRNGKGDCKNKIQRECLQLISVEQVFQTVMQILNIKLNN